MKYDTRRIICYACVHLPYQHPDTIPFLTHVRDIVDPTLWINGGDEVDFHQLSYHESSNEAVGAEQERSQAYNYMQEFYRLSEGAPTLVLASNHGSMVWRKAKSNNIPKHFIKSYEDVWGAPKEWRWVTKATLTLPNGQRCRFAHQMSVNMLTASQNLGMNAVGAHHHNQLGFRYWNNGIEQMFGGHMGCLVDQDSIAMEYSNANIKQSVLGCVAIIDSEPVVFPMHLDENRRWIGRGK